MMIHKAPGAIPPDDAPANGQAIEQNDFIDVRSLVISDFKEARPCGGLGAAKPPKYGGGGIKHPPRGRGEPPFDPEDGRVVIKRTPDTFDEEIETAIAALADDPPEFFRFGDKIVKPQIIELRTAKEKTNSLALKETSDLTVRAALSRRTRWVRFDGRSNDWVGITPPKEIAAQIVSAGGSANLPAIYGLVGAPCLRPDGTILCRPGYDAQSGLFYLANNVLEIEPVPDKPSRKEADEALEDLVFLISAFPFVSGVDRSVALSLVITPTLRAAFDVVPMHAVKAPVPGSGKSLLCDLASAIAFGEKIAVIAASRDFLEVEKAINGAMLLGVPLISLDNWNFSLESNLLAQAVERSIMSLRQLGSSAMFKAANNSCLFVNGNGLTIAGDILRRTVVCNLDP